MEMDRLEAYGELEDYILFWVNMPVLDFARDFSSKAHLQRLQDRRILRSTFHIRESSCTFAIQFRDSGTPRYIHRRSIITRCLPERARRVFTEVVPLAACTVCTRTAAHDRGSETQMPLRLKARRLVGYSNRITLEPRNPFQTLSRCIGLHSTNPSPTSHFTYLRTLTTIPKMAPQLDGYFKQ